MSYKNMTKSDGNIIVEGDVWHSLLGQDAEYINDKVVHNGNFVSLQVIEDVTFVNFSSNWTGNTVTSLPVGIYNGHFTSIRLSSGSLIAYKGVK